MAWSAIWTRPLLHKSLSLEVPGVAFQIIEMTYHFLKPVITIILKTTV